MHRRRAAMVPDAPQSEGRTAADLLRRRYIALSPGASLREAESVLVAARARGIPVVEAGRLAGLLTHRGLHERYAEALRPLRDAPAARRREAVEAVRDRPVREAMIPPEETATRDTPLPELARRLQRLGTGWVSILGSGAPSAPVLGIVTESDLLRAARDACYHRRAPVPEGS